jgi:hypothetical protein
MYMEQSLNDMLSHMMNIKDEIKDEFSRIISRIFKEEWNYCNEDIWVLYQDQPLHQILSMCSPL